MNDRHAPILTTLALAGVWLAATASLAGLGNAWAADGTLQPAGSIRILNPYAQVEWDKVEYLHSFSHQHGSDPQVFWDLGFRHLPLSNYYPSQPFYPLPEAFLREHPDALGAPNAEQHSTTDSGIHFNALGSLYTTGYGQTPRVKAGVAPVEHLFTGLNVFDADNSPWLGIYRLDLSMEPKPGADEAGRTAVLTVQGARQVNPSTFALVGDGAVQDRRLSATGPGSIYLKTEADSIRVRIDFDPAATGISRFRLMQGTNRPWRDAFRAALDGDRQDAAGRPIEGLLFPDGGGITINHPWMSADVLMTMLDFDPRVLGIEVWNHRNLFGGIGKGGDTLPFYNLWDEVLRTGRPCFGFFVKDHFRYGRGRNVLIVPESDQQTRQQREREALRAYRTGRFFGHLGAMTVDESGKVVAPYDYSEFRFTRIAVRQNERGEPAGLDVSVHGADRAKRPNTQIRFITDAGLTQVSAGEQAYFAFPRDPGGTPLCRYVRVEAFAYPSTHLEGRPLTAEDLAAMNVLEIARLHDRRGDISPTKTDPDGQAPIAIVDMLFSQPILVMR